MQRGGAETGIPIRGASHSTGKPSSPPLTPGALKKAGKKESYSTRLLIDCTHYNCIHRFNSMTGIKQQIAVVLGAYIQYVIKFLHCHRCLPQAQTSGDSHTGKLHPPTKSAYRVNCATSPFPGSPWEPSDNTMQAELN